jgi:ABC-type multidrug transport system fused ATPase/permease subunit
MDPTGQPMNGPDAATVASDARVPQESVQAVDPAAVSTIESAAAQNQEAPAAAEQQHAAGNGKNGVTNGHISYGNGDENGHAAETNGSTAGEVKGMEKQKEFTAPAADPSLVAPAVTPSDDISKQKGLGSALSSATSFGLTEKPHVPQPSPELKANWLSHLSYWWLNAIVARGARSALMFEDMYAVNPSVDAKYCSDLFDVEWKIELDRMEAAKEAIKRGDVGAEPYQPSINKAFYRIFKVEFWIGAVTKALIDGLAFLQPILIEYLLTFVVDAQYGVPQEEWKGYVFAVALGINPFLTTVLNSIYFKAMMVVGLRARTILTTQLYKKSLRLSPAAKQSMSVGQIVNMMSTDASKVDLFCGYLHFIWSALEQIIIAIALLVRAIGPPALAGVGVVIIMIPIQGLVMKHLQDLRRATVKYTDARVKLMNEILQGIRVIKVYAWEGSFLQKLVEIRAQEMRFVRKSAFTRAYNSTIMQTGPILMSLLAFITLGLTSNSFEPQYIFQSLVLFNLLRMPLLLFPMTLAFWSDARIGIQRITAFLLAEELHSEPEYVVTEEFALQVEADFTWERVEAESNEKGLTAKQAGMQAKAQLAVAKAAAGTTAAAPANTKQPVAGEAVALLGASPVDPAAVEVVAPFHLDGVKFTVPKGSLTVIVGAVGTGKSSLLNGILGEMKRTQGTVKIAGSVGYCPQQAWIQNSTLKDNILFGLPFDQKKYDEAIKFCALQADIDVLPAKDMTEIGEKGSVGRDSELDIGCMLSHQWTSVPLLCFSINLSGGQVRFHDAPNVCSRSNLAMCSLTLLPCLCFATYRNNVSTSPVRSTSTPTSSCWMIRSAQSSQRNSGQICENSKFLFVRGSKLISLCFFLHASVPTCRSICSTRAFAISFRARRVSW